MNVDLTPEQPPEIEQAVAAALDEATPEPDPWWEGGLEESLGT